VVTVAFVKVWHSGSCCHPGRPTSVPVVAFMTHNYKITFYRLDGRRTCDEHEESVKAFTAADALTQFRAYHDYVDSGCYRITKIEPSL
jgi:hypothetical protein